MSDYRSPPPVDLSPDEQRMERGCLRIGWGIGLALLAIVLASVYGLVMAFWPAGPEEHAKDWVAPPRRKARDVRPRYEDHLRRRPRVPAPAPPAAAPSSPQVPPPVEHKPAEVPMSAQGERAKEFKPQPTILQSYTVGDEHGSFTEPPVAIVQTLGGQETVTLSSLLADTPAEYRKDEQGSLLPIPPPIVVPVTELRMVQPFAKRTKRGNCCGSYALQLGRRMPRNSTFYHNPRVACAAYTAAVLRHCGRPGASFSATAQYGQLRRWGGKLVATRMSTSYLPYLKYLQAGDYIYFHKGSRFGHTEVYVGKGLVSGTSSSQGRVAIRRLSKRGFKQCSVVRL